MGVIQDEVSICSVSRIFGIHYRQIKYLVSKFESIQQDNISKKQKNLIEIRNQYQIYQRVCALIRLKLGHQSHTDWEIKSAYCARIILNLSYLSIVSKYRVPKSTLNKYFQKIYPLL